MNIKETLKENKITQDEFACYVGLTREALNLNLNKGTQKLFLDRSLTLLLAEKKGFKYDVEKGEISLTLKI